jgi:hypothetical protein
MTGHRLPDRAGGDDPNSVPYAKARAEAEREHQRLLSKLWDQFEAAVSSAYLNGCADGQMEDENELLGLISRADRALDAKYAANADFTAFQEISLLIYQLKRSNEHGPH